MRGDLPLSKTNPVAYLVTAKFPTYDHALATIHAPTGRKPQDDAAGRVVAAASSYMAELSALTPDAISERVKAELEAEVERARAELEAVEEARPFNRPYATADFVHWAKMSYWSLDECVALSLGKEPEYANWHVIEPILYASRFARLYETQRSIFLRAKEMGQLWDKTIPCIFMAWAERMKVEVPRALTESVTALGTQVRDWKTSHDELMKFSEKLKSDLAQERENRLADIKERGQMIDDFRARQQSLMDQFDLVRAVNDKLLTQRGELIAKRDEVIELQRAEIESLQRREPSNPDRPLGARERDSLLKLIIGLAIEGYRYDPKAARNPAVREMVEDLEKCGLSLDDETIRKYLAEAKDLLPAKLER